MPFRVRSTRPRRIPDDLAAALGNSDDSFGGVQYETATSPLLSVQEGTRLLVPAIDAKGTLGPVTIAVLSLKTNAQAAMQRYRREAREVYTGGGATTLTNIVGGRAIEERRYCPGDCGTFIATAVTTDGSSLLGIEMSPRS